MPKVLIVDDEEMDRLAAERCLRSIDGLEVGHARSGEEALEHLDDPEPPDVVLTDLRMPGMDGLALVERLRRDHPRLPVVLMTSRGNEEIAARALRAGASSYVPKRRLSEDLAETVLRFLDVVAARRLPDEVLEYLEGRETRFRLASDPALVPTLTAYLQQNLERLGFADDATRYRVGMAVMEALSNAIIHGNLEVASELRRTDRAAYYQLIAERREREPYASRRVTCIARERPDSVEYAIADEGPGFDPHDLPDPTAPDNLLKVSGRGIMLIRTFMDEVEFSEGGNEITMRKHDPSARPDR